MRRPAAVLVPVYRGDDGERRLVLVRRAEGGVHGGQIAFPGGKREPQDASLAATALREAEEEIGVDRRTVRIVAALPALDTSTTDFTIAPFLAHVARPSGGWRRQEREIAEVLDVPLDHFARPETRGEETREWPSWPAPRPVAFFRIGDAKLWGATYRILDPLLPSLLAGEWDL